MKYTGQFVTGDFEENTMTFQIEGKMILQAGKYSIEDLKAIASNTIYEIDNSIEA